MDSIDREEEAIQQRVVGELVSLIPETWLAARMEVTRTFSISSRMELAFVVTSPEGHGDVLTPSAAIYESVHELASLYERRHVAWSKATYSVSLDANGDWDFRVAYEYPEAAIPPRMLPVSGLPN